MAEQDGTEENESINEEHTARDIQTAMDDVDDVASELSRKLIRKTRFIKLFNTLIYLVMVIVIMFIAISNQETTGYRLVAYLIALMYGMGGCYFLSIIAGSKSLHYIYVKRKHIDGFHNFVIPECTVENKTRTIKSVSALTATFGSNAHGLFSRFSYASVGAVFSAIIIQWNTQKNEDIELATNHKIAAILMLCGVFGNVLYGTWELEGPNNCLTATMHYSCAPLIFVLQTLAYCIQSDWAILSVILFIVGIVLDIIYVVILYGFPETSQDLSKVHQISFLCIMAEFAALTLPCLSVVLFVHNL